MSDKNKLLLYQFSGFATKEIPFIHRVFQYRLSRDK